jgi:hypothetical protein
LVIEQKLQESLGTRVHIEPREQGGKITIDYFLSGRPRYDHVLVLGKEEDV